MSKKSNHSIKHFRKSRFGKHGIFYYVCYFNQPKFIHREFVKLSEAISFLAYAKLNYDSDACIIRCCFDKLHY